MLNSVLADLNGTSTDIEASAIISVDGLAIATALQTGMDEDKIGAMAAAMLSLGDRTAQELARGELEQVMIKGSAGFVILIYAGADAVLSVITKKDAKLGLVFLDVKRAAQSISELI
jgi:predicted regulator of Ras-like GTPase activity (Roadblock/LC7/MglB family)